PDPTSARACSRTCGSASTSPSSRLAAPARSATASSSSAPTTSPDPGERVDMTNDRTVAGEHDELADEPSPVSRETLRSAAWRSASRSAVRSASRSAPRRRASLPAAPWLVTPPVKERRPVRVLDPRRLALAVVLALGAAAFTLAQDAPAQPPAEAPAETPAQAPGSEAGGQEEGSANERIITIDGSGGTQRGNLRSGPIVYEHPDPRGIRATVSTLTIFGSYAELTAPEGTSIARGGERTATFRNGVEVNRG